MPSANPYVYVGTYTNNNDSEGVYVFQQDSETGKLSLVGHADHKVLNPTYVNLGPSGNRLYSTSEVAEFDNTGGGGLLAFEIDPDTGRLTLLNKQPTLGAAACHVAIDPTGRVALAANYSGGSVTAYPVTPDGRLGEPHEYQHEPREGKPKAHQAMFDPNNRFALVTDLGLDRVYVYKVDHAAGRLTPNDPPFAEAPPKSGPRHMIFHPSGTKLYVIGEHGSNMTIYDYDPVAGALTPIKTIPTIPDGFEGKNYCADVHISADGRFLYGSNRGHHSIVIYRVSESGDDLTDPRFVPSGGDWPRNFCIDPSGAFVYVANQKTDNIVTYRRDASDGMLTPTGDEVSVPAPVCVKFR